MVLGCREKGIIQERYEGIISRGKGIIQGKGGAGGYEGSATLKAFLTKGPLITNKMKQNQQMQIIDPIS